MKVIKSVGKPYARCSRSKNLAQLWKTLQNAISFCYLLVLLLFRL